MSINAAVYHSCGDASAHATTVLESLLTGPQSLHCCASLHKTLQHCESIVLHEQLVVLLTKFAPYKGSTGSCTAAGCENASS